jgi:hypothetical protein
MENLVKEGQSLANIGNKNSLHWQTCTIRCQWKSLAGKANSLAMIATFFASKVMNFYCKGNSLTFTITQLSLAKNHCNQNGIVCQSFSFYWQ